MNLPQGLPPSPLWPSGAAVLGAQGTHLPSLDLPDTEEAPGWRSPRGAGRWREGPHPAVEFPA